MQSPLKRAVVYDLETGGLKCEHNSITEIAMVAIDLSNLTIIDEMSVLLKPRIDVNGMLEDHKQEAKEIYKRLSKKNEVSGIKELKYGKHVITPKNLEPLIEGCQNFFEFVESEFCEKVLTIDNLEYIGKQLKDPHIVELYLNNAYNPEALEVTKIPLKLLIEEGIEYEEAFKKCQSFLEEHTIGNSKPIISGHNIGYLPRQIIKGKEIKPNGFDNPFMEIFFKNNGSDWFSSINTIIWDTLVMARTKFFELASYSLGTVANEMGLTLISAHRALPDTLANAKVLIKMLQSLRGDGSKKEKYKREKFSLNY